MSISSEHAFPRRSRAGRALGLCLAAAATALSAGCAASDSAGGRKAIVIPARYDTRPPKQVPDFMKGTVYEYVDVEEREPYLISGYGLVVGLEGTGNNGNTPLAVRQYMIDEMLRRGFGSDIRGFKDLKPEPVLRSGRAAIVEVYAFIPPGARSGQAMDVLVRAVQGSETTSLARGSLYRTDLFVNGVDPLNPRGKINVYGKAQGPVFVNPGHVSGGSAATPASPGSSTNLREGTVMHGGLVMEDRPIRLRVRAPQLSVARAVELRINHRFQNTNVATTKDEGIVFAVTPQQYAGDWEHFIGVATHLYLDTSPGVAAVKARMLAEESVKPDAKLLDISYCWEGLGQDAVPFIQPLYTHRSSDVAFAAARAGAFLGDYAAEEALADMAKSDSHPFQLNAVQTLGALPQSTRIDRALAEVLPLNNALARIEAYRVLTRHESPIILSKQVVPSPGLNNTTMFWIDRVLCEGPPLVYAARTGMPRIAIFGRNVTLNTPIMFRTLDDKFTISTAPEGTVTVFDRASNTRGAQARIRPDVMEMIYRLGGGSDDGFRFGYADVIGILQGLSEGRHLAAAFVLQDLPGLQDAIENAPPIIEPAPQQPAAAASAVSAMKN